MSALSRIDAPLSTLYRAGRKEQAQRWRSRARLLDYSARYYGRHPDDRRALKTLASASFHLAWTTPQSERMEQWKLTLGYYDRLLADEPGSAEAQRNVALVEKYIGALLRPAESAPHLKRAVELNQARLAAAPDNRQAQLDTAISLAGLARVLESQGDLQESSRLSDRSVEIRRRIADTDRADVQAAGLFGSGLIDAARVQGSPARSAARESPRRRGGENPRGRAPGHQRPLGGNAPRLCVARARPGRRRRGGSPASCRAFRRASDMYRTIAPEDVEPVLKTEATREAAACRVIGGPFKGRRAMPPAARVPDTSCWSASGMPEALDERDLVIPTILRDFGRIERRDRARCLRAETRANARHCGFFPVDQVRG